MFKIGDFSRLSRVAVKTLRYYDEIGLLKPKGIDRFTRYRFYSVEQLPTLYRILALKELGFSLEQIGRLLEGDLTPEQLTKMLQNRRAQIEKDIHASNTQLAQVGTRLRQIEQDGCLPYYEVILKQVRPQLVASACGTIPGYDQSGPIFNQLFEIVGEHIQRHGARPAGAGLALYSEPDVTDGSECIQVEVALPLSRSLPDSERVRVYELPEVKTMAAAVHHGSYATLSDVYPALLGWCEANGYRLGGPTREVYLHFQPGEQADRTVTEVQFPVQKIRKDNEAMQPKIVSLDKFLIVGMPYLGKNEHGEISQMWQEFNQHAGEIRHLDTQGESAAYGICSPNPQDLVDYVAAFRVARLADIPAGMVGKEVPAQTYAVFAAHGVDDIGPTYQHILKEWLPKSDYKPGNGPDFEYYPKSFNPEDPNSPESVLHIYFPVVSK